MLHKPRINTLRYLRTVRGVQQADLAQASGLSQARLSAFETNRALPSREQTERLACVLGCDAEALVRPMRVTIPAVLVRNDAEAA